jgi:hypothetical protein
VARLWHALGHGDPTGTSGCSQFGRAADACQGLDFTRGMGARDSPLVTASDRCVGHDEGTTGTLPRSPDHLIRVEFGPSWPIHSPPIGRS